MQGIADNTIKFSHRLARLCTPRMAMHAALVIAVAAPVLGSRLAPETQRPSLLGMKDAGPSSYASMAIMDTTAAANVAASVAQQTNLIVTAHAAEAATTLNAQVPLPTVDEDILAKRQVVQTAGNATRDIVTYTVAPGDTISSVAGKHNITTDTLRWANNLSGDTLSPGQELTILPVTGVLHTVAAGDTAESLAAKYQANAAQIISFNNAEATGLKPGVQIIVPGGAIPQTARPVTAIAQAAVPAQTRSAVAAATGSPRLTNFAAGNNNYSYGYCTWYVANRRAVPGSWGNAVNWYYSAQRSGFSVGSQPIPGAIAWTPAGYYGHVAYVEQVSGGMVLVSEMNYNGWARISSRWVPAGSFSYIY